MNSQGFDASNETILKLNCDTPWKIPFMATGTPLKAKTDS